MRHFSNLCTEIDDDTYDKTHCQSVKSQVKSWVNQRDDGPFLNLPITREDVMNAVKRLNKGKAPRHDSITAENLQHAGTLIHELLAELFNRIIQIEYIPLNTCTGTQIPLYKGKNLCALDPNNYRGIT